MKSYTNLEQSRKLAEFLPLESADMGWNVFVDDTTRILPINDWDLIKDGSGNVKFYPAWSLTALFDILAEQGFIIKSSKYNNEYMFNIDIPSRHCKIWFPTLLDAAFEMVVWLKENGKL